MGRKSNIDERISQRASRRGLIHVNTLRELGLTNQAIAARCRAHALVRAFRGVYFIGHRERTPVAGAEAAVLGCGNRAALSHDSAAAVWGLRKWPRIPEISSAMQHKRPGIRAHRTATLTRGDVSYRQGIRVTTVAPHDRRHRAAPDRRRADPRDP